MMQSLQDNDSAVLQLLDAYSSRDTERMVATLDRIIADCRVNPSKQEALGTHDCIKVIMSFFAAISEGPSDVAGDVEPIWTPAASGQCLEQQARLVEKCYWVLVRLCRREMDKSTANAANIQLIENFPNVFEVITATATRFVTHARIALPVAWLVMILASDSAERMFKLTGAGATTLIVSIMNEHLGNDPVAEMSCRAARNLASGETDLVAKLVEDKVCDALVNVIHTQLKMPLRKAATENDTIIAVEELLGEDGLRLLYKDDVEVNEAVCEAALWAIVNLACDENVAAILGSVGGIEAVVDLSYKCRDSGRISHAAVSAIRNISSVGTLNYSLLAKTHVCTVLLAIIGELDDYCNDLQVIETALWAVTNLACNSVLADRLGSLNAATVISDLYFSIVPQHPPEGRPAGPISEAVLWTIVNLSASGADNEKSLGDAGAVELVGLIMRTYLEREGMVELALNALVHLVFHCERNKSRIGGSTAFSGLLRAELKDQGKEIFPTMCSVMGKYKDNENIEENALRFFLLSLNGAESSAPNKELLLSLNVLSLIAEVMSENKAQTEVIRLGCGLTLVLRYEDIEFKSRLGAAQQLDDNGKARPKGTYEEIAAAWEFGEVSAGAEGAGIPISSVQLLL